MIYNILDKKIDNFVINFWGDIRIKWEKIVHLEDPKDETKIIGSIILNNSSIASSAWNKRIFWSSHHLLNAKSGRSQDDKLAVFVHHKLACFADIFATTLFVCPLEKSLEILSSIPGLEAMIIAENWEIYKSKWFTYIK